MLAYLDWTSLLLFLLVFLLSVWYLRLPSNLPPGPINIPLLGFVPLSKPKSTLHLLESLRRRYGDIFVLWQGSHPMVVLFGRKLIREALVEKADYLSERPCWMHMNRRINKGKGIIWSPDNWRGIRKFVLNCLRDFGAGAASLEAKIHTECEAIVKDFTLRQGQPFDCHHTVVNAISNIICMIVFGKRYEYDDPDFLAIMKNMDEGFRSGVVLSRLNYFPWLASIAWAMDFRREYGKFIYRTEEFLQREIDSHKKHFDPVHVSDFIDLYLEMESSGENNKLSEADLRRSILDLFNAGTETTATTLQWLFVYMMRYPDIQEKCRAEIHERIGSERLVCMSDRSKLVYTEAVLLETQRLANIAPWSLPHSCHQAVRVGGYTVPRHAMVMCVLQSAHLDPNEFEQPEVFQPERWIQDGKVNAKHPAFMPFSLGRRNCLGEQIAKMELFLFGVTFLQKFKFEPVGDAPSMEGHIGLTRTPYPFQMKAVTVLDKCDNEVNHNI